MEDAHLSGELEGGGPALEEVGSVTKVQSLLNQNHTLVLCPDILEDLKECRTKEGWLMKER